MTFREIIKYRDRVAGIEQFFRANRPDITGAAGDKYGHADSLENFSAGESSKKEKAAVRMQTQQRLEKKAQV